MCADPRCHYLLRALPPSATRRFSLAWGRCWPTMHRRSWTPSPWRERSCLCTWVGSVCGLRRPRARRHIGPPGQTPSLHSARDTPASCPGGTHSRPPWRQLHGKCVRVPPRAQNSTARTRCAMIPPRTLRVAPQRQRLAVTGGRRIRRRSTTRNVSLNALPVIGARMPACTKTYVQVPEQGGAAAACL